MRTKHKRIFFPPLNCITSHTVFWKQKCVQALAIKLAGLHKSPTGPAGRIPFVRFLHPSFAQTHAKQSSLTS